MLTGITNFIFGSSTSTEEQVDLKISPADNEWLLVDKESPRRRCHGFTNASKENSPSHFVHVKCSSLEESWLVTPPPCFTAGSNEDMASGPLENLLIEHPSMSVYGPRQRTGSVETENSSESEDERRVAQVPNQRPGAITAKAALRLKYKATKSVQITMHRYNTRSFTRSKLDRQNMVHLAKSHKRHNKRSYIIQPASKCISNKKC